MLHKSFKSSKCKTALKLATSRMKLMKNKKSVQMNQMKKDLAQLLETGQDQTARIRVEHVIREGKMVSAYDLIEIYCELIVARLPIIESQKTCPIDLKEAVASVIFAAPRCSDISELADIKKQFTAKYGKEFVIAAIELRPDCGVSRMLVEKLSAVAPNVQTKVKVLSDVAKEHNIEWDPTSFEEKDAKPPNDLLNGTANIEKASISNTDFPKIQPSNISVVHSHEEKPNAPFDFAEQNRRYTLGTQNVDSNDKVAATSSVATHQDISSSGINSERMETQPDFRGDNDFQSSRENWNMEFKDATSAAQAAAESAERAAIAARAAAQFSNQEKIAKQHQTGSRVSNTKDETPRASKDSYESSSDDRQSKTKNQHINLSQHETSQKAASQFSSREKIVKEQPSGSYVSNSRDESSSVSKDSHENSFDRNKIRTQHVNRDRHDMSQKAAEGYHGASHGGGNIRSNNDTIVDEKLVNVFHMKDGYFEESVQEQGPSSPEIKIDLGSSRKESFENEDINYFAEESTIKQPSIHSSSSSDEADIGKRRIIGNPFAVIDQGSPFKEATNTNSNVDSQRYDEPISDDDDAGPRFDSGGFDYDEAEATQSLENSHIWSPKRSTIDQPASQSHLFSESLSFGESSVKSIEASDHVAHFDSDGPDSESESELISTIPKPSYVESSQSSDSRKSRIELNDLVEVEPSFDNPEDEEKPPQSQRELKKHISDQDSYDDTLEDNNDSLNQPNDLGLNFGSLTGGLRNKSATPDALSDKSTEANSVTGRKTFLQSSLDSDSDSDDFNPKSRFSSPAAFVNDDRSNRFGPKDVSKQVPSRVHVGSGISRRTRGSPSVSYLKTHVDPKPKPVISSFTKDSDEYSYSNEIAAKPRFSAARLEEDTKKNSESKPLSFSRKTAETGSNETQRITSKHSDYNNETKTVEKKPEPKSVSHEPGSSRIAVESGKTRTEKSEKLSEENIVKKASHVHPKLPDYDSLAARLQSLRNSDR